MGAASKELMWSHAMYVLLCKAIEDGASGGSNRPRADENGVKEGGGNRVRGAMEPRTK